MTHLEPGYVEREIARVPWPSSNYICSVDYVRARAERDVARAQEIRTTCPTKADYVAELRATFRAVVAQNYANGVYDRWEIVGWCGRPDLAHKLAASTLARGYHAEAKVLEAVQL
jgi:hypothetical protein